MSHWKRLYCNVLETAMYKDWTTLHWTSMYSKFYFYFVIRWFKVKLLLASDLYNTFKFFQKKHEMVLSAFINAIDWNSQTTWFTGNRNGTNVCVSQRQSRRNVTDLMLLSVDGDTDESPWEVPYESANTNQYSTDIEESLKAYKPNGSYQVSGCLVLMHWMVQLVLLLMSVSIWELIATNLCQCCNTDPLWEFSSIFELTGRHRWWPCDCLSTKLVAGSYALSTGDIIALVMTCLLYV